MQIQKQTKALQITEIHTLLNRIPNYFYPRLVI